MNKVLGLLLVAAIAVGIVPFARGIDTPAAPPGVRADHWISMGDAAGFVITNAGNDLQKGLRSDNNVVKGFFMVRRGGAWLRIDSERDAGAYPTDLTH
jgi:hypothetical protein